MATATTTVVITTDKLIEKFQYALNNKWGYILGAWHTKWSQALQNAKVKHMVTTYGDNWKSDANAKKDKNYTAAAYGERWIGRYVTDCSGLFYWAFKELGGYMYHGSNTMWKKYCVNQGKLINGKRSDNCRLKPGTAVFVLKNGSDRSHVGLYIGGDTVIEASGTKTGVITSKITDSKWAEWGELKGVLYGKTVEEEEHEIAPAPAPAPAPEPEKIAVATVNNVKVALRAAPSTTAAVLARLDKGTQVELVKDEWTKVKYQGKVGYMMTKFLNT